MAVASSAAIRAAAAFGLDPSRLRPLGGYSGSAWEARDWVLRVGHRLRMDTEQAAMAATTDAGARARVLHLDLHPLNILVSGDGEVTGVLDWANAAAGDPVLDRARSWAILNLDLRHGRGGRSRDGGR